MENVGGVVVIAVIEGGVVVDISESLRLDVVVVVVLVDICLGAIMAASFWRRANIGFA